MIATRIDPAIIRVCESFFGGLDVSGKRHCRLHWQVVLAMTRPGMPGPVETRTIKLEHHWHHMIMARA